MKIRARKDGKGVDIIGSEFEIQLLVDRAMFHPKFNKSFKGKKTVNRIIQWAVNQAVKDYIKEMKKNERSKKR